MKTHLLISGAKLHASGMSASAACKTNRGHNVNVSRDRRDVDCKKCLQLPLSEYESEMVDDFELPETIIVHFGTDLDMIEPDARAWCRRKVVDIKGSYTTPVREDVTCSRCILKMSK